MIDDVEAGNTALAHALADAFAGKHQGTEKFFAAFLKGPVFIPERFQSQPLSNAPQYPNDFINILGVQDGDRVIVPVFSDPASIEDWSGVAWTYKSLSGKEALELLPENWWIIINPGATVEKEFSPWEIQKLKEGEDSLAELLHEFSSEMSSIPIAIRPLANGEFEATLKALTTYAESTAEVQQIRVLAQDGETENDTTVVTILIGVSVGSAVPANRFKAIQSAIDDAIAATLIGVGQSKIFLGYDEAQSVMLGMFKNCPSLFKRQPETGRSSLKGLIQKLAQSIFNK